MLQTKVLPGSVKIEILLESITDIFRVLSEHYNNKDCKEVSQPKVLPGSATNKSTSSECNNQMEIQQVCTIVKTLKEGLTVSVTFKRTDWSIAIKRNARECLNQKEC